MKAVGLVLATCLATFATTGTSARSQTPDFNPQARVTEALEKVRPMAYHTARLDWVAIEARARALAETATDEVDLLPAYQAIVWYLEDNHSFLWPSDALKTGWQTRYGERRLLPDSPRRRVAESPFNTRTLPTASLRVLSSGRSVAMVVVPAVLNIPGETRSPYGDALYSAIAEVEPAACGFIVDLRGNTGGDVWPMVTGLSDLVGDGYVFGYVTADGEFQPYAVLREGAALTDPVDPEEPIINQVTGWRNVAEVSNAPTALLIDGATGSSGEGAVLSLLGRTTTRTFGSRTYGVASSNDRVELSDGTVMYITTMMAADRNGQVYPDGIAPDEAIEPGPGSPEDPSDAVEEAAMAWLVRQPACEA